VASLISRNFHAGATTTAILPAGTLADPLFEAGGDFDEIAWEINITVAGTTGTYALEGSLDGTNWFTVTSVAFDAETAAQTFVYTTTGRKLHFAKTDLGKFYRYYRINPSVVTGQTFDSRVFSLDQD